MTDPAAFAPYDRDAYLATVREKDRAVAARLCELLESVYPVQDIQLCRGFPIVVRDMEWIAGFAMRAKGPMVYCCSPSVLEVMGKEMAPLMSGKSCMELKARPKAGITLDDAFAMAERAFKLAADQPGCISKTDMKKRERMRRS